MLIATFKKYKAQLGDSVWSLAGLVVMNAVAQIVVFPRLAARLGDVDYGNLQYLMAYINILAVSAGVAANYGRMTSPTANRMDNNGDFHLFLLIMLLFEVPFTFAVRYFGGVDMDFVTMGCYYLLFATMTFRYYNDVTFKLTLRYRRYFIYYLSIAAGYGVGAFLFHITGIWPLALLPGELAGVLYAYLGNDTLHKNFLRPSAAVRVTFGTLLFLLAAEGISNLIVNADRLLLKSFLTPDNITIYYNATLVGKTVSFVTTPLNGVLLGYLARYEGKLSRRAMSRIVLGSLASFALMTGACVFGGWVVALWLYPQTYDRVIRYLLPGSLAQVIFFTTSVVTVVLVRFAKKWYQLIINGAFGICFFGFGIPAIIRWDLKGFAWAMVAANAARWLTAVLLGLYHTRGGNAPPAAQTEAPAPEPEPPALNDRTSASDTERSSL